MSPGCLLTAALLLKINTISRVARTVPAQGDLPTGCSSDVLHWPTVKTQRTTAITCQVQRCTFNGRSGYRSHATQRNRQNRLLAYDRRVVCQGSACRQFEPGRSSVLLVLDSALHAVLAIAGSWVVPVSGGWGEADSRGGNSSRIHPLSSGHVGR